jgi:hypothetical protein
MRLCRFAFAFLGFCYAGHMAIPDSVKSKLVRAQGHLDALQAETATYYKTHPAKVVRKLEGSPEEFIGEVVADFPIPTRLSLIIGDFLQNLRSSLDYLVWELVLAAKNTPDHNNMFPICATQDAFKQQLARHRLYGVSVDAIAEIEALQPYHDGQDPHGNVLIVIDNLCNINKHRRVLTTIMRGGIAPDDFTTRKVGDDLFGSVSFDAIRKKGPKIGPFPMIDGPLGPGPKVNAPLQILAFISLDEGVTRDAEVGFTLSILGGYVMQILPKFERFFVG